MDVNDIKEVLENECYDIVNDLGEEKVAKLVKELIDKLSDHAKGTISLGKRVEVKIDNLQFVLCNKYKGFVSCSNTETGNTAVSRTEYYPYYYDSDDRLAGLTGLVEMVNEAYYSCVND